MELKTRVAVIGAGHAGIEAALASARMGVDTILFTAQALLGKVLFFFIFSMI